MIAPHPRKPCAEQRVPQFAGHQGLPRGPEEVASTAARCIRKMVLAIGMTGLTRRARRNELLAMRRMAALALLVLCYRVEARQLVRIVTSRTCRRRDPFVRTVAGGAAFGDLAVRGRLLRGVTLAARSLRYGPGVLIVALSASRMSR